MKSRRQKAKLYEEKYSDIPRDYLERMSWMYDKYHINMNKADQIIQKRDEMLKQLSLSEEFFIVLYEEPEGTPRPRARYINKSNVISSSKSYPGYIQIYSLTGASDRKFMNRLITDQDLEYFNTHLIYTPCFIEYTAYLKTPSTFNIQDTMLAEMGMIRPITKPDFDNLSKKYSDMYNGNIWVDDDLVVEAKISKYYSILPRVEISLYYLNMLYNKQQAQTMQKRVSAIQEIQYFK